jgi:hypothetical protein
VLTSRLAVRDHLSGAQIEISCIAIDITILMSPQRTVDVAPAGFEPATHGLGNLTPLEDEDEDDQNP